MEGGGGGGGEGARKVLVCCERGAKSFRPAISPFRSPPLLVRNDRSLIWWCDWDETVRVGVGGV